MRLTSNNCTVFKFNFDQLLNAEFSAFCYRTIIYNKTRPNLRRTDKLFAVLGFKWFFFFFLKLIAKVSTYQKNSDKPTLFNYRLFVLKKNFRTSEQLLFYYPKERRRQEIKHCKINTFLNYKISYRVYHAFECTPWAQTSIKGGFVDNCIVSRAGYSHDRECER